MVPAAELSISDSKQHRITTQSKFGRASEGKRGKKGKKAELYCIPSEKPVDARVTVT